MKRYIRVTYHPNGIYKFHVWLADQDGEVQQAPRKYKTARGAAKEVDHLRRLGFEVAGQDSAVERWLFPRGY